MRSTRKFTHINIGFHCEYCKKEIKPLVTGCRNHCPHCLSSKHVDIFPGDRANDCAGQLKAIGYDFHKKKGIMLIHECQKCRSEVRNKAALEDPIMPDNYDKILSLSKKY